MNGTQQRTRRTALSTIEGQIADMHEVIVGLAQTIVHDRKANEERFARLERTFWQRLRGLFKGPA